MIIYTKIFYSTYFRKPLRFYVPNAPSGLLSSLWWSYLSWPILCHAQIQNTRSCSHHLWPIRRYSLPYFWLKPTHWHDVNWNPDGLQCCICLRCCTTLPARSTRRRQQLCKRPRGLYEHRLRQSGQLFPFDFKTDKSMLQVEFTVGQLVKRNCR